MKKVVTAIILIYFVVGGMLHCANAEKKVTIIGIGPPVGMGPYEQLAAIHHVINAEHPWLRCKLETTAGGYAELSAVLNPPDPAAKPFTYATYPEGDLRMIQLGWVSKGETPLPYDELRALAAVMEIGQIFVTFDPNIKKIEDLADKAIATGRRSQTVPYAYPVHFLEEMYGMREKDMNYHILGTDPAAQALIDGRVDAAFIMFVADKSLKIMLPTSPMQMLMATGRKLYYIPLPADKVMGFYKKIGVPYFPVTFPTGCLPQQSEPYHSAYSLTLLHGNKFWSDEVAYAFTKALIDYHKKIADYHALGKLLTPDMLSSKPTVMPWHPGSERAFREAGWIK